MSLHQAHDKENPVQASHPFPGDWQVWRIVLWISAAACAASLYYLINWAYGTGHYLGHYARGWLIRMLPVILIGLTEVWVAWTGRIPFERQIAALVNGVWGALKRLGWFNLVFFLALPGIFITLIWSDQAELIERSLPRGWLLVHLTLLGGVFWSAARQKARYLEGAAYSLLFIGVILKACSFIPAVSASPFRLDWSEASRYYEASLFFSKSLYGTQFPLPVLHPSRYLMQAVPFLISGLPLWAHRLWQVILWLGMTFWGGYALARRLSLPKKGWAVLVAAWAGLFFFQGAVYYHLMVCVIVVLLGFDRGNWKKSTLIVVLASLWAGLSRINWYPVPGAIAAVLYILETPEESKPFWRYWFAPVAWICLGSVCALAAQSGYALISGNDLKEFGSSLTSDLLWYRLFPNPTFPPGLLRATAIASVPLLLVMLYRMVRSWGAWLPLRWAGLMTLLLVFFTGGLWVSVKIGGGADLHNMDAFLVILALTGVYLAFDRFVPDWPEREKPFNLNWVLVALALVVPVLPTLDLAQTDLEYDQATAEERVAVLQQALDAVKSDPREVLFISDRQLITFGYLKGVTVVDEYEKVFLMEMAMADNEAYLDRFKQDLANHRFKLIITEDMEGIYQNEKYAFSEENNAWMLRVAKPFLEYYMKVGTLHPVDLEIYAPNP